MLALGNPSIHFLNPLVPGQGHRVGGACLNYL